jgi:hypothetical protein
MSEIFSLLWIFMSIIILMIYYDYYFQTFLDFDIYSKIITLNYDVPEQLPNRRNTEFIKQYMVRNETIDFNKNTEHGCFKGEEDVYQGIVLNEL